MISRRMTCYFCGTWIVALPETPFCDHLCQMLHEAPKKDPPRKGSPLRFKESEIDPESYTAEHAEDFDLDYFRRVALGKPRYTSHLLKIGDE